MTKKYNTTISVFELKQTIHNCIRDNLLKYSNKQTMQQLTINGKQLHSNLRNLEKSIKKIVENGSMGNCTKVSNVQDKITIFMHNINLL